MGQQPGQLQVSPFTPATRDSRNTGARLPDGSIRPPPHHLFVDDDIYADIFDSYSTQQAVAASIKAIYILLGESDLSKRQDPVSFDKLEDMPVSYPSRILGQIVNTQRMDVKTPPEFIADTIQLLDKLFSILPAGHRINHGETWTHRVYCPMVALPPPQPLRRNGQMPWVSQSPSLHDQ